MVGRGNMENVTFEKKSHVGIITISRPKALNALNSDTLKELDKVISIVADDRDIYSLVITGAGEKAFVAGADIAEMMNKDASAAREFGILGNGIFRKLELLPIPTIAAVNGFALGGGCELALSCDIRIAGENAKFGQPEVTLGITPGFGGTQRLPRLIGTAKALEMIFTGELINAEEALKIGLVNRVVPREKVMEEAMILAEKIAANAPIALKMCKAAVNRGMQTDINTALAYESEVFALCFTSEDQKDAMSAFIEKRKIDSFKNK
jgi:enoyl-CoA hydratase